MSREWFTLAPGQPLQYLQPDEGDVSMVVIGSQRPDVVRLPAQYGGQVVRIVGEERAPCPRCGAGCKLWRLDAVVPEGEYQGRALAVLGCAGCEQWLWTATRPES